MLKRKITTYIIKAKKRKMAFPYLLSAVEASKVDKIIKMRLLINYPRTTS
jgi:hypothetical protein